MILYLTDEVMIYDESLVRTDRYFWSQPAVPITNYLEVIIILSSEIDTHTLSAYASKKIALWEKTMMRDGTIFRQ